MKSFKISQVLAAVLVAAASRPAAFDGGAPAMKLKLDANGAAVLQDGKPVYVKADGTEVAFDAASTVATIARLNAEAKAHREGKETAEAALKPFKDAGITDPAAAAKALQTMANLDSKTLVDAGQVETVKQEAIKAVKAEYEPVVKERDMLKARLNGEVIGGGFARSKFIAEKCAVPADLVQARFGQFFTVLDDGKVEAKDANGNVLYSQSRPGEKADMEEALPMLIEAYPYKAQILKGTGASGGGAGPNGQPNANGKPTITRSAYEALPVHERAGALKGKELVDG